MRRKWTLLGVSLLVAGAAFIALAHGREHSSGPLTGTWGCVAHSSFQDDVSFTLDLKQDNEDVAGKFANSSGAYALTSASYRKGVLEFHVELPDGKYLATGKLLHGQLSGHWSKVQEAEGGWECQKSVAKHK
jgi:hypothetical protein